MEDVETIHESDGVLPEENLPLAAQAAHGDEHSTEPAADASDAAESGEDDARLDDDGGALDSGGRDGFTEMMVAEGWESTPAADPEDRLKAIIEQKNIADVLKDIIYGTP